MLRSIEPTFSPTVVLSGIAASRSEAATQWKDLMFFCAGRGLDGDSCGELLDVSEVPPRNTGSFDLFAVRNRTVNLAQDDNGGSVQR
jgi:hypothetical protein